MDEDISLAIADEQDIRGRIYVMRGYQVMLDYDLAQIYGYTTKAFNQQVRRNIEKFPGDFMFQLTEDELSLLSSRSQYVTLNASGNRRGSNIKYLPYAFTEQGVYMLMTVLKGELATRQSMALIRLFKSMKDCMAGSQEFLSSRGYQSIIETLEQHKQGLNEHGNRLRELEGTFEAAKAHGEILIMNNERFTAEYSGLAISFTRSCGMVHDRYIVLDFKTDTARIFHCGASSKDADSRMTSITELRDTATYIEAVSNLLSNPPLVLR